MEGDIVNVKDVYFAETGKFTGTFDVSFLQRAGLQKGPMQLRRLLAAGKIIQEKYDQNVIQKLAAGKITQEEYKNYRDDADSW